MTHERNVEGLKQSAAQRHLETVLRTEQGIRQLVLEERPVNFHSVAQIARVSCTWLYRQTDIRQRIEHLRTEPGRSRSARAGPATQGAGVARASDVSKDAMLATLRQRVKHLEEENRGLKAQLEVVYGQLRQAQERPVRSIR